MEVPPGLLSVEQHVQGERGHSAAKNVSVWVVHKKMFSHKLHIKQRSQTLYNLYNINLKGAFVLKLLPLVAVIGLNSLSE